MCWEECIDFLLLKMDTSGVIHNMHSPLLTMPILITVREIDLQHPHAKKAHYLRCAKRAGFCPYMLHGELAGGVLRAEGSRMHCQGLLPGQSLH